MTLIAWLFAVHIVVQPMRLMRYDTVGDWTSEWPAGRWVVIYVADLGSWRYNFLVALHEAVEARLCLRHGITQQMVDAWDIGPGKDMDEPGDDSRAPYHREHVWAERVERAAALVLGVNWKRYGATVEAA